MKKYKLSPLIVSLSILSGCTSSGRKIENKYDEVLKKNVCRVHVPYIVGGFGREANLTIERENNGIKAMILTHDISTLIMKDKNFYNNPSVTFNLFTNGQLVNHIDLKSQTLAVKNWNVREYNGGNVHHSNATALIPLTINHLKEISNAESVTLVISDGKHPLEGNISASIIELIKQFVTECFDKTKATS